MLEKTLMPGRIEGRRRRGRILMQGGLPAPLFCCLPGVRSSYIHPRPKTLDP